MSVFGSAAAPTPGAFSFGGSNPAPAPGPSGFPFGSTSAPTPAASTGFGGFGTTPTPAPGGFGSTAPTPAAPFGSTASTPAPFGATPAPAFGSTGFGKTPAPAGSGIFGGTPSSTNLFSGASNAPAPTGGGPFGGGTTSAFGGGGGFGSPAPALGGFGFGASTNAPASAFGGATPHAAGPPTHAISGKTLYMDLPPHIRQMVDDTVQAITQHRRTMATVQSMGPSPLVEQPNPRDGGTHIPLKKEIQEAKVELESKLAPKIAQLLEQVTELSDQVRNVHASAVVHGIWPVEMVANHRGIRISNKQEEKKEERIDAKLYATLERYASHVNRVDRLPSEFFWQALDDFQRRLHQLQALQEQIKARGHQEDWEGMPVTYLINNQDEKLFFIRRRLKQLNAQMDQIRAHYTRIETQVPNVLEEADMKEAARNRQVVEQYQRQMFLAKPTAATPAPGAPAPGAPAPAPGLFGAPAPSAPAPSSGFSFGPTPAPAPGGAVSFGGTAPAPAPGAGLFGSAPAPGTGLFGGTTPAPAPGTGLFGGATPAPGPSGFGATPAAPFGGFGAAPTPAFGASTTTFSTTSTPRKNKPGGRRSSKR